MRDLIYVVGRTEPQEVYIASNSRKFVIDEYLVVNDENHYNPIGEVIETFNYPRISQGTFVPSSAIYESLEDLGLLSGGDVYIAKLKILKELSSPVMSGSTLKEPEFATIQNLLMPTKPGMGFTLGVVKGTESFHSTIPKEYQNIAPIFDANKGSVVPQLGVPFILEHFKFREYPHIGLYGGSGSGKTHGLRVICEEIMLKNIPGVILDPHYELSFGKSSTIESVNFSDRHEVFQVGENVGIKFSEINTDELISLLEYTGGLTPPMIGALQELHNGSDSFSALISKVEKIKRAFENNDKPERDREVLPEDVTMLFVRHRHKVSGAPTLQALGWRLEALNKTGIFNSDVSLVEICLLKRKLAVIRGKQRELRMLSSYLINKLYRTRRTYKDWAQSNRMKNTEGRPQEFPPFFVLIDEAHEFAPKTGDETPIRKILREISQEARKYGVFLVLGTQRPALLDTTITAQLNTKIIFRTTIESDMQMIKTETNLNAAQVKRLPELTSGNAFISSATLRKTFYLRIRSTMTVSPHSEHPFDELDSFGGDTKLREVLIEMLPIQTEKLSLLHAEINSKAGKYSSVAEIIEVLDGMCVLGMIKKDVSPFGTKYKSY